MKKVMTVLMALMLVFSIAACDSLPFSSNNQKKRSTRSKNDDDDDDDDEDETTETSETSDETEPTETEPTETVEPTPEPTKPPIGDKVEYIDFDIKNYYEYMSEYPEDGYYGASYNIDCISISPDNGYVQLQENIEDYMNQRLTSYQKLYEQNIDAVEHDAADGNYYYITEESLIKMFRADSLVLSFEYQYYYYYGGAHGQYGLYGLNYNPITGEMITFSDITADTDKMYDTVIDALANSPYADYLDEDYEDTVYDYFYDYGLDNNFAITYDGIHLFFNPYELAPFAAGLIEVYIPYEGNEDCFEYDYWTTAPSNRFIPFTLDYDNTDLYGASYKLDYDFDFDGTVDEMAVFFNEEDGAAELKFSMNGEVSTFDDFYGYDLAAFLVIKDGKSYIMLNVLSDNDYRVSYVCRIQDNKITEYFVNDGVASYFVNPDRFIVKTRLYCIGTNSAYCYAGIEDDLVFHVDPKYYTLTNDKYFDTVVDISGTNFMTGEAVVIPAGSKIRYDGTDYETYALFETEDGDYIRIDIETGYPEKLNGIDVEDCFEEGQVIYAG